MFNDEKPKAASQDFPRNLERLSIEDLDGYVQDLEEEIDRVRQEKEKKKASAEAAASIFKS